MAEPTSNLIANELAFLTQNMKQDEATILAQALQVGIHLIYRQTVEQLFIDGEMARQEAVNSIGEERVAELEYAQHALAQEVAQGLNLG